MAFCLAKNRNHRVKFEVFTVVAVQNNAFWDIEKQFLPHGTHYFATTKPIRLMLCRV
jgi:hypothetical protein